MFWMPIAIISGIALLRFPEPNPTPTANPSGNPPRHMGEGDGAKKQDYGGTPPVLKAAPLVVGVASLIVPDTPRDENVDVRYPRVGAVKNHRPEHNTGHNGEDAPYLYSRQDQAGKAGGKHHASSKPERPIERPFGGVSPD